MDFKLLLATNNQAKVGEYKSLLSELPAELVTLNEIGITISIDETGTSLEENARLKAVMYAAESKLVAMSDDSGLEVDALNGEPGPLSARYAGENASDRDRVGYLLSRMGGIPWERRVARFRCVIGIAMPDGRVKICSGERRGLITFEPRGGNGFGYDPIFYLPEMEQTMAELSPEAKNQTSHRREAVRKAYQVLEKLINDGTI